jgi:hypothetical protein
MGRASFYLLATVAIWRYLLPAMRGLRCNLGRFEQAPALNEVELWPLAPTLCVASFFLRLAQL